MAVLNLIGRFWWVFFLIEDLELWSLCSLVWSLVVKLLQAFLAGRNLFPKFKQDIATQKEEQKEEEGFLLCCEVGIKIDGSL